MLERLARSGILLMAAAALLFSAMSALAKFCAASLPSAEVVFFRSLIATLLLLGLHRARGRARGPLLGQRANRPYLLLRGLLGAAALLLYFYALGEIAVADAMLLNQCSPLFVLLLAAALLAERIRLVELLLVPVTLLGVGLVIRPDWQLLNLPGLAAFGSAALAGGAYVCVRKVTRGEQAEVVVLYFAVLSTLASLPLMLPGFRPPDAATWLALGGVALFAVAAQLLLTAAYRYDLAGRVAAAGYLGPVFAGLWDYLFWDRLPSWTTWLGALLIIGSLVALERRAARA
ncbi:MAG: DMT family transporter [Deltaproteobacteria bacterium]|nr:DMT family transporter [Deltaproteobacteria bacterium]